MDLKECVINCILLIWYPVIISVFKFKKKTCAIFNWWQSQF